MSFTMNEKVRYTGKTTSCLKQGSTYTVKYTRFIAKVHAIWLVEIPTMGFDPKNFEKVNN